MYFFVDFGTSPACFNVFFMDIQEGEQIGMGVFTIYKAQWLGHEVAVNYDKPFSNVTIMSKEFTSMLRFRHPTF